SLRRLFRYCFSTSGVPIPGTPHGDAGRIVSWTGLQVARDSDVVRSPHDPFRAFASGWRWNLPRSAHGGASRDAVLRFGASGVAHRIALAADLDAEPADGRSTNACRHSASTTHASGCLLYRQHIHSWCCSLLRLVCLFGSIAHAEVYAGFIGDF